MAKRNTYFQDEEIVRKIDIAVWQGFALHASL